ncbi:energy transducer TonB [Hymenobacter caeli]|uniref:Protein TonB n=2 Tax=Hymenobacter caeli TaxID=2735894 RepID=A0ABX2FSA4_9BACT|nr:energy transducer TonB [Hymenobacter caeli]NRT19886.1 protein TonB [Hymenobacter caeli]
MTGLLLGASRLQAQDVVAGGTHAGGGAGLAPAAAVSPDSIYVNTDSRPAFAGGDAALTAYLRKNIHYPEAALRQQVSGRVYVSFVLDRTGRVTDAHVVRGPGYGLNDEALRLVWLMPNWQPALQQGQPVRTACTIPINFDTQR